MLTIFFKIGAEGIGPDSLNEININDKACDCCYKKKIIYWYSLWIISKSNLEIPENVHILLII